MKAQPAPRSRVGAVLPRRGCYPAGPGGVGVVEGPRMSAFEPSSQPRQVWMGVLEQIEQTLGETLERAPVVPPRTLVEQSGKPGVLERLEERLRHWQEALDQATAEA